MYTSNILLFSGGIDSYIAYWYLCTHKKEKLPITPIYFDYNGIACKREQQTAHSLLSSTQVIKRVFNLDLQQSHDAHSTLFGRNLYFCTYAAQLTKQYIYLCGLKNSAMLDNTPNFYKTASSVLSQISGKVITVQSPFLYMEKEEIVQWFLHEYKGNINSLLETTSCYHPTKHYCGECLNCFYLYCSLYRHTNKLDFTNLNILKDELLAVKLHKRAKYRAASIMDLAQKKGIHI